MRSAKYVCISLLSVLTLFCAWYIGSSLGLIKPSVFPTPGDLYDTLHDLLTRGYSNKPLLAHIGASMMRAMTGFLFAVLVGVPIGLLIGYSLYASAILAPIFTFLRPIPAIAFIPLVILYFGIGEASKIAVVFMTSMMYVVLAVADGVKSVPRILVRAAENLGVSRWQIFKSVIFPGTLPHIMSGIKTATALSWALVVAAEMIAAQEGLGYIIIDSATFYRVNYIYIGIAAIGFIAFALERLVTLLERRLVHWTGH